MDRQRLIEAALQAVMVGVIVGGVVLAGFDRVDKAGKARWVESSANRLAGIQIALQDGRKIDAVHSDLLRVCGAHK